MSTGKSYLVWAERFNLKELKSQKDGTYNQNGSKESKGAAMIVRSYAEARNAQENNEIYVFDEEKTSELMILREQNIKKQAQEAEKKKISSEDVLANALVKALGRKEEVQEIVKPEPKKEVAPIVDTLEDLKYIIKEEDLGIRISKEDTREKVEAKIKDARLKK